MRKMNYQMIALFFSDSTLTRSLHRPYNRAPCANMSGNDKVVVWFASLAEFVSHWTRTAGFMSLHEVLKLEQKDSWTREPAGGYMLWDGPKERWMVSDDVMKEIEIIRSL